MGFKSVSPIFKGDLPHQVRHPFPSYQFTCSKANASLQTAEIYQIIDGFPHLIYEHPACSRQELEKAVNELVLPHIHHDGMISGGHSVVNLADKLCCGDAAYQSTALSMALIETLETQYGKRFDFLVQYNDLYVDKDENPNSPNMFREAMFSPFIVPSKISQLLTTYSERLGRNLNLHYCTSKTMADKFKRYIKTKKTRDSAFSAFFVGEDHFWTYSLPSGESIVVLKNNKPNCAGCNVSMLRDIRYHVSNNKIKDYCHSYIGIFPVCSRENVLNGAKLAYHLLPDFDLQTYFIFWGGTCN